LLVEDLGSQNGTFVNDVITAGETLLVVGDTLRVGAIVFEVQAHLAAPIPVKSPTVPPSAPKSDSVVRTLKKAPAPKESSGISDHEIAAWLSDHDTPTVTSLNDTTIIRAERPAAPVVPASPPIAAVKPAAVAPPKLARPRTVKEEAADIIRRHWAKVRGDSPDE
jgi:hypothetical protein